MCSPKLGKGSYSKGRGASIETSLMRYQSPPSGYAAQTSGANCVAVPGGTRVRTRPSPGDFTLRPGGVRGVSGD